MKNNIIEIALGQTWVNMKSRALTETAVCTVAAVIFPVVFAHTPQNQFIVGPVVNAILFWVALRIGITNALFIAVIPSLIALFRGLLPPTAAAMIPFIILGNCTMILVFAFVGTQHAVFGTRYSAYLRVIIAALVKSLVIALPSLLILDLSNTVSFMMSWPQLVTALIGGFTVIKLNGYLSNRSSNT